MELRHQFTVPASVGTTWDTFMDLAGVASCFPGATVTSSDGDRFEGTVKVKLGPIALMYAGSGTFVSRDDEAHQAVIEAKGKDKRGNGTAGATVTIALADDAGSGTAVDVRTDLSVTGKPAQFGRGVMQDVSDKLLGQFVACLEQRFAESGGSDGPEETAAPATVAASNGSGPAAGESESDPKADTNAGAGDASGVEAAAGSEAAPATAAPAAEPAPAPAPAATPAPRAVDRPALAPAAPGNDNALDLGATLLPVLLRTYAPQLVAGAIGFVLGALVARSRRR